MCICIYIYIYIFMYIYIYIIVSCMTIQNSVARAAGCSAEANHPDAGQPTGTTWDLGPWVVKP